MIYFVNVPAMPGRVKIGHAADVTKRIMGLQTGCPHPLNLIAVMPGDFGTERSIHKVVGGPAFNEWFEHKPAMAVLRLLRKFGPSALRHIERMRENERRERRQVAQSSRRKINTAVQSIARDILSGHSEQEIEAKTGTGIATWRRARRGSNMPSAHVLFNTLLLDPRYLSRLTRLSGLKVVPYLPAAIAIVEEADAIRGRA